MRAAIRRRDFGNAGFMLAAMLAGLRQYEEATGGSRIAPAIIGGARFPNFLACLDRIREARNNSAGR